MDSVNQTWLSDVCLRLLSVMALDRFGDFVSDEVGLGLIGGFVSDKAVCV